MGFVHFPKMGLAHFFVRKLCQAPFPKLCLAQLFFVAGVEGGEERAVAELLASAKRSIAAGSLADGARAADLALALRPDHAEARALRERAGAAAAPPPETPAPAPAHAEIFNKKNLKGLEGKSGAFVVKDGRIAGDSGGVPSFLLLSRRPPRESDLRAVVDVAGAGAGLVAFRSKGKGIAFVVSPAGAALRDLATGADLATGGAPGGGGVLTLELKVLGPLVRGFVNGTLAVEAALDSLPTGDAGFVRFGAATLHELGARPSFAAQCLDAAAAALASDRTVPAALAAAAALEREGAAPEGDLVRAAALAARGRLEEALAARERGRASRLLARPPDPRVKKLESLADKAIAAARERRAAVDAPFLAVTRSLRDEASRALAEGRNEDALALATRLSSLLPADRAARLQRLRAYGRARGKDGVIPLFDGTLAGWTVRKGTFAAEDGVLRAPSEFAAHEAVRADIEGYPRAFLEAEFRASSVYEAGLVVGGPADGWGYRFTLRNVLHEREFLVRREDGEVKMRRELADLVPKGDGAWHRLSLFIHRNRVAVFVDGRKALEKVFSRPLAGSPGLYVAESTQADFRNVTYRIFDDDAETERFLYENGLGGEILLEAEEAAATGLASRDAAVAAQPLAFNGETLAIGGGREAEPYAEYVFDSPEWKPARLHVRYQRPASPDGDAILVSVDGALPAVAVALPPTGNRDFGTVAADIGALAAGEHRLRVVPKDASRPARLDRLMVVGDARPPEEASLLLVSPRHPLLVIQTSPGVKVAGDFEPVFDMVDDVRGYMSEYLGVSLEGPLTLNVVSRECWADPHLGGYATGRELYVPEETVFRDLATVAHELSHCFDHGQGFVPPWFGEGKSVPVFVDFMAERGERYKWNALGGVDARARMGRGAKKTLMEKEGAGGSLLAHWGTDRFSYGEHPLRGAAYDASAFLCADLRERHGRQWLKNFHALVSKDLAERTYYMPASDRVLANSVLVDYLSRATGEDLRAYFAEWGFEIRDLARPGEAMTAAAARDDAYLTGPGASSYSVGGDADGAPPGRVLESGEMVFTFPLPSGTTEVEFTVSARGRGRVLPDGGEPISIAPPGGAGADREEKRVVRDAIAFADGRFHVIVAAGEGGITVSRIEVRPSAR